MDFRKFGYIIFSSFILISACLDMKEEKVIYIKSSSNSTCPARVCLTLSQFAANQTIFNFSNITLKFLPGNHSLTLRLMVTNIAKLSMIANTSPNICCQHNARLAFENISQVSLQGLRFIGCDSNKVLSVKNFMVENSSFIGQEGSGTVLKINESDATFVNCSFLFNAKGTYVGPLQIIPFWRKRPNYDVLTDSDYAFIGGAIMANHSNVSIFGSRFNGNHADIGGAIYGNSSSITIKDSRFVENSGCKNTSKFCFGGVIYSENYNTNGKTKQITIMDSFFYNNTARYGGVLTLFKYCTVSINHSTFNNNIASDSSNSQTHSGTGVMALYEQSRATINECKFNNNGQWDGAVVTADNSAITIRDSLFWKNVAEFGSAVLLTRGNVTIHRSNFYGNHAFQGGALNADEQCLVTICDSIFDSNFGEHFDAESKTSGGAIMMTNGGKLNITRTLFRNNTAARGGAISISTNVEVIIINCSFSGNGATASKGGAIKSSQSDITFYGKSNITNNTAVNGGAVYAASDSVLYVYGELLISENSAINNSGAGGGVYLYRSKLNCQINSTLNLLSNKANSSGGGIFAINSIVTVFSDRDSSMVSSINFTNNTAKMGGGIYLELAAELHVIKSGSNYMKKIHSYRFIANSASANGGAIYNADETNYEICASESYYFYNTSVGSECFLQIQSPMETFEMKYNVTAIEFLNNTANGSGQAVYGGLLDRCIIVPGAEIYLARHRAAIQGVPYILSVSNLNNTDAISSLPIALCFCEPNGHPNCSYQPLPFKFKKGEKFQISLAAVDQVNRTLANVTVYSSLKYAESGLDEGQMAQVTTNNCTDFSFTVYSRNDSEEITLYPNGPCRNATLSQKKVNVIFRKCNCFVGFQQSNFHNESNCTCVCDPKLWPYVSNCQAQTKTVTRKGNVWITYLNDTNLPNDYDYLIYPYCPLDYCLPPSSNVQINLSAINGADAQCANNRSGMLCGACQPGLSLSLGSSRCMLCPNSWHFNVAITLLAAVLAGILLVAVILIFKLTVAAGTLNGLIFYANIIDSSCTTFFPSSPTKVFYVLTKWLNLEIGLDICFYEGMTTYWKIWLQLAFPLYVIALVVIIIIVSRYFKRFSDLIGNQNPVATLATLILFSYAKLLRVIITALSMVTLHYPDGSHEIKWLPDATVDYSDGKHIIMVLTAILILLVGIAFTLLLLLWQWIVRWMKSTKLHHFIEPYLAPYLSKHRYWTGLLLLARVVTYLAISLNGTGDPSINLLVIIVITSSLLFLKGHFGQIYRDWKVDGIEMICYLNILLFSAVKMFTLDSQTSRNATVAAFISGSIMLLLLVVILAYHIVHCNVYLRGCITKLERKMYGNRFSAPPDGRQREPTTTCTVIEGLPHRDNPPLNINRDHEENLEDITGQLFQSVDGGRSQASTAVDTDDIETPLLNDTRRSTSKYTY